MPARVLIIQFPGVNCEYESKRVVESVGLKAEIRRWNDAADAVRRADAVLLPGGWSYQDRIRAGVVAAKDAVLDEVVAAADRGVPVIGICNGAQVLVETGIVPGFDAGRIDVALAPNIMTGRVGYYCNWVHLKKGPAQCIFTDFMSERPNDPLPIPLAHGEGRFVTSDDGVRDHLAKGDGVAVVYCTRKGEIATAFPDNPNGAQFAIAGLTNPKGNVLAIMPHPERAAWAHQVPRRVGGMWGRSRDGVGTKELFSPGPGRGFFESLRRALV
ncbi:MAG: phosphoribosylformylglycinamidine synthase I [Candidatus Krumholzibacteria bacterium]|nr:phosphoribosylformylglycinamidine synthase I [Candidatus Krumholzibacteria bacterium]MDH4336536.1 phosphoribosylformylglycinamidine synthase I [Candidatus Krumholzibacteria bacterium]MDH5269617.1 phosphoribosylformylglycinamidine synthase I [Candidatus Krumholzibacteria bacterium]